jgi:tetratricopeptide (TPR) repeat protein
MYYHIKLGDVIAHAGIIHQDVLSQIGSNKLWVPSEWLFEVILYCFISLFGFNSFRIFIAIFAVLQVGSLYALMRRILNLNTIFSLGLSVFFLLLNFDLFTGRPQIVANTLLISELFILLLYILRNKNFLYLLIPLTYFWANIHGSVILSPLICLAYFIVSIFNSYIHRQEETSWLKKAKVIGLYALGVSIVSILPPQGFAPYQHLLSLLYSRAVDSRFVSEWRPLYLTPGNFLFYTFVVSIPFLIFLYVVIKKKTALRLTWFIPLIVFILSGYSALRNTYYGYIAITIIIGWLLTQTNFLHFKRIKRIMFCTCIVAVFGFLMWAMFTRSKTSAITYPENAANFIQREHIAGNMFNQYAYGGYLEYRLYPRQKVLIDGRVLLCCELHDYYPLTTNISLPNSDYAVLLNQFFDKHHISFALLNIDKDDLVGAKISSVILNNPQWSLVFWDDTSEIFIKNDGENTKILTKFTAKAAEPFESLGYIKDQMDNAYHEYEQMTYIQDSALTRNMMGNILFNQKKIDQAGEQYVKAIHLNASYANAYYNLAQVKMIKGEYPEAIDLLKQALAMKPTEGLIYIQLSKTYLAVNDKVNAIGILQQALSHAVTDEQRQIFNELIQKTQASQ